MKTTWQTKKLSDVSEIVNGGTPKTSVSKYWNGNILWITPKDMGRLDDVFVEETGRMITEAGLRDSSAKVIPPNSVILSTRAPIGHLAINKRAITTNQGCKGLIPAYNLDVKFLYYFLEDSVDLLNSLGSGTTFKELSGSKLKEIEIPFPALAEQKRIVKKLDEVFEILTKAKEVAEKNLQNSKELFESYLQSVFTNSGEDWERKKLGDIGKVSMCKRVFKQQTSKAGDIPFYKIGTFGKSPDAFISNEIYNEFRKKYPFPKKGDVLLSASGTIGRRVRYDGEPAYFQDSNIVWIDNDEKQVLNNYLYQFYGACNWNPAKGATISRLYNDNLRKIEIPFPKSFAEQKTIVKKLEALSAQTKKLETIYEQKLADLEELNKSILSKAFRAEL